MCVCEKNQYHTLQITATCAYVCVCVCVCVCACVSNIKYIIVFGVELKLNRIEFLFKLWPPVEGRGALPLSVARSVMLLCYVIYTMLLCYGRLPKQQRHTSNIDNSR